MTEPFLGEVRAFSFSFAPRGWAMCLGQLLPIAQNTALFSLLGTNFGGDGKVTFGLPNFSDRRVPIGTGQGPGLSPRFLGEPGGTATVTLQENDMAMHQHALAATSTQADVSSPTATTSLARTTGRPGYAAPADLKQLNPIAVATAGNGGAHNNLMPTVTLTYCIAVAGIYPSRP